MEIEPILSELSFDSLPSAAPEALRVDASTLPLEGGDDPAFGTVRWKTLFSADRTATSDMVLGIAEFDAGGTLLPHRHEPAEFYLGLSGSGEVTINGTLHPISAGVALFIPGDAEHGVVAGPEGLSFAYGFPCASFEEVEYRFSAPAAE
ncbi:cupin domain-containing protein [Donghicola sp. C2-DW-16]|uniref:Cupin domain-containing protein n=1 Tax=Donghicola mangrovi TaxID=2729614 RepID=A0ABX2PH96_9RHOB|nr:cupin domain-containing protein [Donghicola mangrovi]NVO28372.1 cupin domain-containing protein [Donghicola mangrovi]